MTSTLSDCTSFAALVSATLSVVALSSRQSSICRFSRPPLALISSMTMFATFALAIPIAESGPVWSVTTPTLIGEWLMARSPLMSDGYTEAASKPRHAQQGDTSTRPAPDNASPKRPLLDGPDRLLKEAEGRDEEN